MPVLITFTWTILEEVMDHRNRPCCRGTARYIHAADTKRFACLHVAGVSINATFTRTYGRTLKAPVYALESCICSSVICLTMCS